MQKNFEEIYKSNMDLKASQEERRRTLLEKQRLERQNEQDQARNLEEIFNNFHKKRTTPWQERQQKRTEQTFQEMYGCMLSLQQSEWLREKPECMSDWLCVPCPKGRRCMVVAHNRHTAVYNSIGNRVSLLRSMLPGDGTEADALTILDCIYVAENSSYYVLDVLAFGSQQNLLYCEAEFRFFWLRSKWDELDILEEKSYSNQKKFHLVKQYDFDCPSKIAECFQKYPLWPENQPRLDGFLFYNRYSTYTCGSTPLVGWLFAFMVPDVLGFSVNDQYVKPFDYKDPFAYMDVFDERLKAKRQKSQNRRMQWRQQKAENKSDNLEKDNSDADAEPDEMEALKNLLESERALELSIDI